jgi:hypothetical protein
MPSPTCGCGSSWRSPSSALRRRARGTELWEAIDEPRRIRFLVPPVLFVASFLWGTWVGAPCAQLHTAFVGLIVAIVQKVSLSNPLKSLGSSLSDAAIIAGTYCTRIFLPTPP